MISAERIYEVFGIGHNWRSGVINRNQLVIQSDEEQICNAGHSNNIRSLEMAKIIVTFPERLVALINMMEDTQLMSDLCNCEWCTKVSNMRKAIESADSKNRAWPEIRKALDRLETLKDGE